MSQVIKEFLKKNREEYTRDIAVIGDAMIDEYYDVSVNRISPEFPMPIMRSFEKGCIKKPGGAANVAYQFKYFNVKPQLVSFTDTPLEITCCVEHNLDCSQSQSLMEGGFVPVKRRYIDGHVQVVRHDVEAELYGLKEHEIKADQRRIQESLLKNMRHCRTAILSDYNKGFFHGDENWVQYLPDSYIIVDPKTLPLSRWVGCEIFKPNYKEAVEMSGTKDWKEQCRFFQKEKIGNNAVVITCGGDGVKGIWDGEFFEYCPDKKVKVLSVVGAGDCFIAGLAMAVSHGFIKLEAIEIAYQMGSQYVQHELNRPITPAELAKDKIVAPEDLANRDYKLVFTNGCFDILHDGHLQTLRFAKSKGEKLVVALNSDESIRRLKGESRPIKKLQQRMNLMAAFEFVDFVVSFDEDTPQEVLDKIRPNVLVKGSQYELENIIGADIVQEVYRAPMVEGVSTTSLISR